MEGLESKQSNMDTVVDNMLTPLKNVSNATAALPLPTLSDAEISSLLVIALIALIGNSLVCFFIGSDRNTRRRVTHMFVLSLSLTQVWLLVNQVNSSIRSTHQLGQCIN